jgi:hypothetical protein
MFFPFLPDGSIEGHGHDNGGMTSCWNNLIRARSFEPVTLVSSQK